MYALVRLGNWSAPDLLISLVLRYKLEDSKHGLRRNKTLSTRRLSVLQLARKWAGRRGTGEDGEHYPKIARRRAKGTRRVQTVSSSWGHSILGHC